LRPFVKSEGRKDPSWITTSVHPAESTMVVVLRERADTGATGAWLPLKRQLLSTERGNAPNIDNRAESVSGPVPPGEP
jgi:hypothetical protein